MNGTANGSGNSNGNANGSSYISMNSQMPKMPQSWSDLMVMEPMDIRSVVATTQFQDAGGTIRPGSFLRSKTWLNNATWVNPPMVVSPVSTVTTPFINAVNAGDFEAMVEAQVWNSTHQMSNPTTGLPLSVQKILFARGDPRFMNTFYLDWTGGATSTFDVELSFRDNSATGGNFQNAAQGTIPVFSFPANTYGGTGRVFNLILMRKGRFSLALRLIDGGGNYSMFEFDIVAL